MNFADFKPTLEYRDVSGLCLRASFLKERDTGDLVCYHAVYDSMGEEYVSRQVVRSRVKSCYMFGGIRTYFIYKGRRFYVAEFQKISR